MFCQGGAVGFWRGDLHGLPSDLAALRPTVVPMVPRQLNRLRDRALGSASGSRGGDVAGSLKIGSTDHATSRAYYTEC